MAGMGPTRILVVDDDEATRELLRDYLSDVGYDVAVAADGRQACRALNAFRVDLVVTDLEMPVMDGLQLIRWLRDAWPACPIVLVTGRTDRELQLCRFGRRAGFQCMTKPIDVEQLGRTIQQLTSPEHAGAGHTMAR
jgi:two-component system, chemotaxis family, chemotaxis protein CheY